MNFKKINNNNKSESIYIILLFRVQQWRENSLTFHPNGMEKIMEKYNFHDYECCLFYNCKSNNGYFNLCIDYTNLRLHGKFYSHLILLMLKGTALLLLEFCFLKIKSYRLFKYCLQQISMISVYVYHY